MSKQQAYLQTISQAKEKLRGVVLSERFSELGLSSPENFRAFGIDMRLCDDFEIINISSGRPVKPADCILVLHYLLCVFPLWRSGEYITFRDLPGGQFYWQPFLSRSINPLLLRIGNDIDLLKRNMNRFDWQISDGGDFAAILNGIGKIDLKLIYHCGDEEFAPSANILFDSCVKRVYTTEDAAQLAGRICLSLL